MTCTMVTLKIPYVYEADGAKIIVQELLDSILPNVLPVALTLLCFQLLKKKNIQPVVLIVGLIIICIILHYFGIL